MLGIDYIFILSMLLKSNTSEYPSNKTPSQ